MYLTKITTPFGLLDAETQAALKAHGGPWERYAIGGWVRCAEPEWFDPNCYRVRPEPLRPLTVRWEHMPTWAKWAARDEDGAIWVFEEFPKLWSDVWGRGDGDRNRIDQFPGLSDPGTVDWRDSLIQRPEGV